MASIDPSARIAPGAFVLGDATLGPECSVWHNAVIRADEAPVRIGARTNIQDCAVIHESQGSPVELGEGVTIGHGAIIHGCSIGDNSLIGMGAIVLDGACIGRNCIIGAGALVTQGAEIPDGSVAFGSPAKVVRAMKDSDIEANTRNADSYVELARTTLA